MAERKSNESLKKERKNTVHQESRNQSQDDKVKHSQREPGSEVSASFINCTLSRRRKAKIVATLGPSSNQVSQIKSLIEAGLDVARVNMSHGTHESHRELIGAIREASVQAGKEVGILADLQGPKIRVSKLPEPIELIRGKQYLIAPEENLASGGISFDESKLVPIPTTYKHLHIDVEEGSFILFDDGLMKAQVIEKHQDHVVIEVIDGGHLKSNKGINLPGVNVSAPSLTEKDREDFYFAIQERVDYVALSFVRSAEDVKELKSLIHAMKLETPVISKIEKPEAVDNIDSIIEASDIIMVARGDMGVEVGNHLVPPIQKKIIQKCNYAGVPVITATQMLESMITNPRPTRAEASDVANAVWDGTDAVMLSGESASGSFPVEAVAMMDQIVQTAEQSPKERPLLRNMDLSSISSAHQVAASLIAEKANARWILSFTEKGRSCLKMIRFRPKRPVLGITKSLTAARKMAIYWGITPFFLEESSNDYTILERKVIDILKEASSLKSGDKIVLTYGDGPFFRPGQSNTIRTEIIKEAQRRQHDDDHIQEVSYPQGKILLDNDACAGCQNCINVCPFNIWELKDGQTSINESLAGQCMSDMACVNACPSGAIEIIMTNS